MKACVDPKTLLDDTASALIELSGKVGSTGSYELLGKFIVDGSSSHKIRHQLIDQSVASIETSHIIQPKAAHLSCPATVHLS